MSSDWEMNISLGGQRGSVASFSRDNECSIDRDDIVGRDLVWHLDSIRLGLQ